MKEIDYLLSAQQKNGSFISFSSVNSENFSKSFLCSTTFITSIVLSSLRSLTETQSLRKIKKEAAKFLLSQKSKYWSWNYWDRNLKEAKTMPYPDDLDDTFCALNALFLYDKKIINGEALANIVNLLTTLEIKEGGPYKTWLVDKNAKKVWKDVDLAVNSNIAYFLFLNEVKIPNLSKFIESKILKSDFTSPYYPTPYPIIYFISRFYNGKHKEKIINFLLERQNNNGVWQNPLNTALAIIALINLGFLREKLRTSIDFLSKNKNGDHWEAYAFCLDPAKNGKKYYAGSESLTTAICLEAFFKYYKLDAKEKIADNKQEKIYNAVLQNAQSRFSGFNNSFQKTANTLIGKLTKSNTDKQILLLPFSFAQSLEQKKNKIPEKILIKLGEANLYGWIAYTIYDNFLDEEGDPKTLSLANVALREMQNIFLNILPGNKNWQIFSQKILDQIDAANCWEISNCRSKNKLPKYGNYDKIAEKSLGHALGPLAILFYLGFDEKSQEVKNVTKFFKHYIIARQLNDDAHDWEKDLKMGHINPVVALLMNKSNIKKSLTSLKKLFWEKVLDEVSLKILQHVKKGKLTLKDCSVIIDKSIFESMIAKYENIAIKALEEKKQTAKFLKVYKNE